MSSTALRCVVVAGVSGSGKTTFAQALATALGWDFAEGDEFHPVANVAKMAAGHALDDEDRRPWLAAVEARIDAIGPGNGLVVTCSALRRGYRDQLAAGRPWLAFCLVDAPPEVIAERVRKRVGHYMPASLLGSQLATLEPLEADEPGFVIESTRPIEEMVRAAVLRLSDDAPGPPPSSRADG